MSDFYGDLRASNLWILASKTHKYNAHDCKHLSHITLTMSFDASKHLEAAQKEHNNNYVDIRTVVCFRRNLKPFGPSVKIYILIM